MRSFCFYLLFSSIALSSYSQNSLTFQTEDEIELAEKKIIFKKLMDSSNYYYNNGEYRKDLSLNLDLLKLAFEINDPYYINKGYRNLGYDFLILGDTLIAKESFEKSEKFAKLSENDTVTALTFMDLANIYSVYESSYDKAIQYHNRSIKLFQKLNDSVGLAKAHYNTILTALEIQDLSKAYLHIIKAKKFVGSMDPSFKVNLDNLLGQYYMLKGDHEMANNYFKISLYDASNLNHTVLLEDIYYYYSENLFKQEKYKEAYDARKEFESFYDINQEKIVLKGRDQVSSSFIISEYQKDILEAERTNQLQAEVVATKSNVNSILLIVSACSFIGLIALFLGLRNRKKLIKELKIKNKKYLLAKEEAEKLSKAKNSFFSTVSHELRTPLYGVVGLTTILLDDPSLKHHNEDLKSLKFSADYLLALINDVLEINKIEFENIDGKNTEFSIRELIKKIVVSFEYMRIQNNNKIILNISDTVPKILIGNTIRLSQVLMNLIGNACKFTKDGRIDISVTGSKLENDHIGLTFSIKDTGVGIPEEKQDLIFEEFSQLYNQNYKYKGTGLGLPIVKKLLLLEDSEIKLKSEVGKGSTFSFTLNLKTYKNLLATQLEITSQDNLLQNKRILIAEDNQISQMVTRKILENNQMECTIAENGQVAVEQAKRSNFDLILMDINMPIKNGLEAAKEIRKFNKEIPILALTAVEIDEMKNNILNSGMNDIIVKPYDTTVFLKKISKNLMPKYSLKDDILSEKAI